MAKGIVQRRGVFLHSLCPYCQYLYEDSCLVHVSCKDCPMYFKPRQNDGIIHNQCHCLAPITTEERKSGKCKFFKQKEDN